MNHLVHHAACPVCHSAAIHQLHTVTDYSVSGETFVVWQCDACTVRFTQDVPDEASIGRYYKSEEYISHTNTGKGLINQLYLAVRKRTLQQKHEVLKKFTGLAIGDLLDIGAGTGAFAHHMQQQGWTVTGIEPDNDARQVAWQTFNLELKPSETLKDLPPQSFDAITLWHVLEHVHDLHGYMEDLKRLLRPGGKLFIAVPNYRSRDAEIYRLSWAAYDVPRHLYHFSPRAMQALVQRHGLRITAQKPMWFDAFYVSLLSSKYKNGKTNWIGAIGSGLRSNVNAIMNKEKCSSLIYVVSA